MRKGKRRSSCSHTVRLTRSLSATSAVNISPSFLMPLITPMSAGTSQTAVFRLKPLTMEHQW